MPDKSKPNPGFNAVFIAAWPTWAGGYPNVDDGVRILCQNRTELRSEIEVFLRSRSDPTLSVESLQIESGTYQEIHGLSPELPIANSVRLSLNAPVVSASAKSDKQLANMLKGVSRVILRFLTFHMPRAREGANLYQVSYRSDRASDASTQGTKPSIESGSVRSGSGRFGESRLPRGRSKRSTWQPLHSMRDPLVSALKGGRAGPYVILRPRVRNQQLYFDYEDSRRGSSGSADLWQTEAMSLVAMSGWPNAPFVQIPAKLDSLLQELTDEFAKIYPGHDVAEVLPVFVDSEPLLPSVRFDLVAEQLSPIAGRKRKIQVVWLARPTWRRRSPFQLPLRAGTTTASLEGALGVMRGRPWYSDNAVVQEHGLRLSPRPVTGQSELQKLDLVLCPSESLPQILGMIAELRLEDRPRVVVVLGDVSRPLPAPLPDGTSLLLVPLKSEPASVGGFIKEFLYGIVHDCSLATALKEATFHAGPELSAPASLVSDPCAIQDVRLQDALLGILHGALDLHAAPSVDPHLISVDPDLLVNFAVAPTMGEAPADTRSLINQALKLSGDFSRERRGLVPIAQARKSLDQAYGINRGFQSRLRTLARTPAVREVFARFQERRVDITLLRAQPNHFMSLLVQPNEKLEADTDFLLRVQIGRRSPVSLIVDDVPSIDPLLPNINPADGHVLHVVLFGQDFTSRSPQIQRVFLPRFGSSKAVVFAITSPGALALGRLRVGIYYDRSPKTGSDRKHQKYRNHLLQMFLLETTVGDTGVPLGEGEIGLRVRLEFSRTRRFANLDQLSERRVSIAINDDPQGSHRLLVKGDKQHQDILWSETAGDFALKSMRQLLERITWDDAKKVPRFPETGNQQPEVEFDKCIKELAEAGGALYDGLWTQVSEGFQKVLRKLRTDSDQVIQVTRLATNFLFPWASLYDFDRPSTKPGANPVEVCKGFARNGYSCRRCLDDCLFPDKSKTYCVYGFWGMRLKVEQVLHTPFQGEDAITEIKASARKAVQISVGVRGQIVDHFIPILESTLGKDSVHDLQSLKEMLKRLWSQEDRPAILLVLGHYEALTANQPRITFAGNEWFEPSDITQQVKNLEKWTDSNPLVVLAACESAAASLASITSFLSAFADARAAGVIGTETTVFEGLACRFAKEISVALMGQPNGQPGAKKQYLGDAVLGFRRRLLQDFNPLGLVFTPYGDADLHRV